MPAARHSAPPRSLRRAVVRTFRLGRGNRSQRSAASLLVVLAALGAAGLGDVSHVVVAGESLWSIAKRYGTTPQAIAAANHLPNANLILIGEDLRIDGVSPPAATAARAPSSRPAVPVTYTVVAGDNLTTIARRQQVTPQALAQANGITNTNLLLSGAVLVIPRVPPPVAATTITSSSGSSFSSSGSGGLAGPGVQSLLRSYGLHFGVNPALVEALAWQESGWQQPVVSPVGAVGVMQLMPATGVFAATYLVQHPVDTSNLQSNVEAGVAFLAYLLRQTGGNAAEAVAGYYQGLKSVRTIGEYQDTKTYVADVLALERRFAA